MSKIPNAQSTMNTNKQTPSPLTGEGWGEGVSLEPKIKSLALSLGFDRVGITHAAPFQRDQDAAAQRVRDGLMDGLPWYTEERVQRMNRPELLPPRRALHHLHGPPTTTQARHNPDSDKPRGQNSPLRLGTRLPQRHQGQTAPLRPRTPRRRGPSRPNPLLRGRRPHERPRRRRAIRRRLVRQEHQHPHPHPRLLGIPRPGHNRPRSETRSPAQENLRPVHPLHPCLPHRRHHRPLRHRQPQVHILPHHRTSRPNSARTAPPDGRLGIRLRPMPGSLPRQPQSPPHLRTRLRQAPRLRRPRTHPHCWPSTTTPSASDSRAAPSAAPSARASRETYA